MPKILLVSYGNMKYDGRLRELIKVCKLVGNTTYITRMDSLAEAAEQSHKVWTDGYPGFISYCVSVAKKMGEADILFADNRRSVIPCGIIRKESHPAFIIQDVRELYLANEMSSLSGKLMCALEQRFMKKADMLLCAGDERASIMRGFFRVEQPYVFKNFRKLEYAPDFSMKVLSEKFDGLTGKNTFKLVSTAGCDVSRTTDSLVLAMKDFKDKAELFLVGASIKEDMDKINKIIAENGINNVHIVGRLNESELKYFISRCDAGVVNYGKYDTNNLYCASGKVYEFIFEGIPIVATDNPPLKSLCDEYGVGVSSGTYGKAISSLMSGYKYYKNKVVDFAASVDCCKFNEMAAKAITNKYEEKTGTK